jgi:hypothetical protein
LRQGHAVQCEDIMKKFIWLALCVGGIGGLAWLLSGLDQRWQQVFRASSDEQAVPFGVLGDSDSHAYHDDLTFSRWPGARGGELRQRTWQWTEVLARLRPNQLDPGPWGTWGTRFRHLSGWRDALGLDGRFPAKQDYLFNQAYSGAVCANLNEPPEDQTRRLLTLMAREPTRWRNGVVVIRMGTNDFGKERTLDALSRNPVDPDAMALIDACLSHVSRSVQRLHAAQPGLRIVLVGIFNNAEWALFQGLWQSPQAMASIRQGLARYDDGLRALAEQNPRLAFFADQAWSAARWGTRGETGIPDYRPVRFGARFEVSNTGGDEPRHATLKDGHAGTVWNALWAQSMVGLLNARFGMSVPALTTDELVRFADPDGRFGMQ